MTLADGSTARRARGTLCGLALAALVAACSPPRRGPLAPVEATSSRVDVFLRCTDPGGPRVTLELAGAELREESGELRKLDVARQRVTSSDVARRVPWAGAIVPPSNYSALLLHVGAAWLERPDGALPLQLLPLGEQLELAPGSGARTYEIPLRLRLERRDAASLFVEWRAQESLAGGAGFAPAFGVSLETPQTALGLLYVTDAGSGSVLAIDRGTGQIAGTFKAGAEPRSLLLTRDRTRVYVANAGDGSISVIDLRQGTVVESYPIGFGAHTSDIVSADPERLLAAANPGLDSVSLLSLGVGSGAHSVPVGRSPVRLAAAPKLQRLFVVEAGNDAISVIDLNSRGVATRVSVEARPSDADVDRDEEFLYVGHSTSPNLLVLDTRTLATKASVFVGADVTAVLADRRRDRVYVARARPAELVVVDRRVGAVVRRIPLSARVESLAQSREGGWLYGAAPDAGALLVIDVVVGREQPPIRCGARPSDVVVAE